jgi:hypothetical protein
MTSRPGTRLSPPLARVFFALLLFSTSVACGGGVGGDLGGCDAEAAAEDTVQLPARGVPFDWSQRHIITSAYAVTNGVGKREHRALYSHLRQLNQSCGSGPGSGSASSSTVDWNHNLGARMADGTFPAKFNFNLPGQTATCSDFVIYGLNVAGSNSQANLIGFANLYSGTAGSSGSGLCNSNPGVYQLYYPSYTWAYAATLKFAYNGSTIGGAITNSVVLSEDGQKIAYVESSTSASVFHVVGVPSGDSNGACYGPNQSSCGAAPSTPASMKTVPSSGTWAATDSFSAVWVDYAKDVGYVGTDNGVLHKIQNIFCSSQACKTSPVSPSEVTTGGWPVTLAGAGPLSSPVQDPSGVVYVAGASGGYLYAISPSGTVTISTQKFMPNSVKDGPILDVDSGGTTQALYWFSNSKSDASNPALRQPQMVQTNSTLTSFNNYSLLLNGASNWPIGGNGNISIHSGSFDNGFYANRNGNLWACGWWQYPNGQGNVQGIVRFGVNGTTVAEDTSKIYAQTSPNWVPATANTCSPITEALDGTGVDRIFMSSFTGHQPSVGNCIDWASCIAAYAVTSTGAPPAYSLTPAASFALNSIGGPQQTSEYTDYTSGMIIDNNVDPTSATCGPSKNQSCGQAASIYFSYGTNAVKLTQSQLQ